MCPEVSEILFRFQLHSCAMNAICFLQKILESRSDHPLKRAITRIKEFQQGRW